MKEGEISWSDFQKIEMRIGTVLSVKEFIEARNPSYVLQIDFGEYGSRKSSAQITKLYKPSALVGKQVIAVVNFPPKQIANEMSECLVLGVIGEAGEVILIQADRKVKNGLRIG